MAGIFGDLVYSDKSKQFIGKPIDEMADLYKKKGEDYNYVLDNMNKTETALNNIPAHSKDVGIVDNAKKVYRDTFETFNQEGDLENRALDTRKLANDLANKYGLAEVQKVAAQKADYIKGLKERFDKGDISKSDMERAIRDAEENYSGVEYNEETGSYLGSYSGREVLNKYNPSEKVAEVLKGFEADVVTLTDKQGNKLKKVGNGYINTVSGETVDRAEVVAAAKSFLANDPDFKDKVADDLYYEMKSLLRDPATGEYREMTTDDLQGLLGTKVSAELAKSYGVNSLENLPEKLAERGSSIEELYQSLRIEQMANSAIQLGVDKESYAKYEDTFLKDWMLAENMKNNTYETVDAGILDTYLTKDNITSEDTAHVVNINKTSTADLAIQEAELAKLEAGYKADKASGKSTVNPDDIDRKREEIAKTKRIIDMTNQRLFKTVNSVEGVSEELDAIIENSFDLNDNLKEKGIANYESRYPDGLGITGLSINKGSLNRLVGRSLNELPSDEELQNYIELDKNQILAEAYLKHQKLGVSNPNKQQTYQDILENGEAAIKDKETPTLISKVMGEYTTRLNTSTNLLKNKLKSIADKVNTKVKNQEVNYTENYKLFNAPNLDAKGERNNPIISLSNYAENITKNNVNYYTGLGSSLSGLDVKTTIEQQHNVKDENGDILWDKGKLVPSVDTMANLNTGTYAPVMVLQVPIKVDDKTTKTIQMPVNYTEPSYQAKYKEAVVSYRNSLDAKRKAGNLEESDRLLLDRLNANLYSLSDYGRELDLLDLYNADNGETIPFNFWEGQDTQIKAYKYDSPQNMSFYLTSTEEVTQNGKTVEIEKFWAINNATKKFETVTTEELEGEAYTAVAANTPNDLKTILANTLGSNLTNNAVSSYKVATNMLEDVSDVYGNDIKDGVVPKLTKESAESARDLKEFFPDLYITDGLRPVDVGYGAENSVHKDAKGLDYRTKDPVTGAVNQDAIKLTKMSPTALRRFNIKSAEIHGKGTPNEHVHVEFLN